MTLTTGSRGERVRKLQENLKALELYPHVVDGEFGRLTRQAVLAFQERYFVDGLVNEITERAVEEAVISWARRDLTILITVPSGLAEIEHTFGRIEYIDAAGGYIEITNDFARNIVEHEFPVVGRQMFHAKLVPVLNHVLDEIQKRGLDREIRQFGTYCPRHKFHDPRRGLSMHSYGIAVDINQSTNLPGARGDLHPGIVECFEMFGFRWGGRWKTRDDMHCEYCISR